MIVTMALKLPNYPPTRWSDLLLGVDIVFFSAAFLLSIYTAFHHSLNISVNALSSVYIFLIACTIGYIVWKRWKTFRVIAWGWLFLLLLALVFFAGETFQAHFYINRHLQRLFAWSGGPGDDVVTFVIGLIAILFGLRSMKLHATRERRVLLYGIGLFIIALILDMFDGRHETWFPMIAVTRDQMLFTLFLEETFEPIAGGFILAFLLGNLSLFLKKKPS